MRRTFICLVVIALIGSIEAQQPESSATLEASARDAENAGRLREAFDLYVRAVQALPDPSPFDDDVRLRERTIALAPRLAAPVAVPEDAERFTVRGQVLAKDATDVNGMREAAAEFRKAVRAAPWIPEIAYNLALVDEKLEFFDAAAANLKLYLLSNPPDADDVRTHMYMLELRAERAERAAEETRRNTPVIVYLFRPKHFVAGGTNFNFYCDKDTLASIENGRYLAVRLPPGLHSCGVKKFGSLSGAPVNVGPDPGSEYFLQTTGTLKMGVKIVSRNEAAAEMAKLKPSDPDDLKDSRAFIPTIPGAKSKS